MVVTDLWFTNDLIPTREREYLIITPENKMRVAKLTYLGIWQEGTKEYYYSDIKFWRVCPQAPQDGNIFEEFEEE